MGSFLIDIVRILRMFKLALVFVTLAYTASANPVQENDIATSDWSPDPCFPMCTTPSDFTSPDPARGCIKTDCFDQKLCAQMCSAVMHCRSMEWILNNDDNDIFGETWCGVDGYGMCYCCDCPDEK